MRPFRRRTTCLHCEQENVTTQLIQTGYGGICPVHSPEFLAWLRRFDQVPKPKLLNRGTPHRARY